MSHHKAEYYIQHLNLLPHPEGGFYRETYRAKEIFSAAALPSRFGGNRHFSTTIFYLLLNRQFSAFHRIKSDEGWHWYAGGTLLIHVIDEGGNYYCVKLGCRLEEGEVFQFTVPAGCWFASEPMADSDFVLTGCTVSPGFDFQDFEMAGKEQMLQNFPQYATLLSKLCCGIDDPDQATETPGRKE